MQPSAEARCCLNDTTSQVSTPQESLTEHTSLLLLGVRHSLTRLQQPLTATRSHTPNPKQTNESWLSAPTLPTPRPQATRTHPPLSSKVKPSFQTDLSGLPPVSTADTVL